MHWHPFGFNWFNIFKHISPRDIEWCATLLEHLLNSQSHPLLKSNSNLQLRSQFVTPCNLVCEQKRFFVPHPRHASLQILICPFKKGSEKNGIHSLLRFTSSAEQLQMLCSRKCRLERNTGKTEKCQETQMRFLNQYSAQETSNYSFKTAA